VPATKQAPNQENDRGQTPSWITLASMFVGQRLDRWAAIGAWAAFAATLLVSLITIFIAYH